MNGFILFQTWLHLKMSQLCILNHQNRLLLLVFFICLIWACWLHPTAWADLKQTLRLSWIQTEMEKGVRSNQHCCHDYVQFTPTCNQATGRAATKPMWHWQVDWTWKGGQKAWAGGWRGYLAECSLVLSSPSHSPAPALCAVISCCTENHRQRWAL